MTSRRPSTALFAIFLATAPAAASAGTFDVKGPEVERGEAEIATNHSFASGFPANADRLRHSFELAVGYALTDRFKAGAKLAFDRPVGDGVQPTVVGIEGQYHFGRLTPAVSLGWFSGLDFGLHQDETNTFVFGPLIKFGDDALSLTVNPLFEHTFGRNRESGVAFAYAVGLRAPILQGLDFGIEAHGSVADIANAPGSDFQEHRIGPVLYIDHELRPARHDQNASRLSLEIGAFAGLTAATPDWTGKIKAALTW